MTSFPPQKHGAWRQRLLTGLLLCACMDNIRAEDTVQSLRYGVTLFNFYQRDYFDALTELLAAQQLQQLDVHADTAELLRGGMSLSYGMDRVAEDIFRNLLDQSSDTVDRDQAWFYLGKMAWQRNEPDRAGGALARMSPEYGGELAPEADFLRGSIDLRDGNEQAAASYVERLPQDSAWRYYLYYNLGAARAAQGDWSSSIQYFSEFNEMRPQSEETMALRDKAYTAAGFAHIAAGDFAGARADFSGVRLESPLSDRALLGYGWAAGELGDYRAALSPWQVLGQRSMLSQSARESQLAVPWAYEQLDRPAIAMTGYQRASEIYSAELDALRDAVEVFRTGDLQSLLAMESNDASEWLFESDILPTGNYAHYLQHLVSRHDFQVALRELRDLYSIARHLALAVERLQVLDQVDGHQQEIWSAMLQGNRREALEQRQQVLGDAIRRLRQRLDSAAQDGDIRQLADAAQSARWARLQRAGELADRLGGNREQLEQLRLLRGLMIWEDNESYPGRVWRLQREVQELEALAAQSAVALRQVDNAIAQRRQSDFAPRIAALQKRVRVQAGEVERAIGVSETGVRQLAVTELERQSGELSQALGRARLSIARLYDQGSPEIPR